MHILIIPTNYPNNYNLVSNIFFKDQAEALSIYGHKVGVLAFVPITIRMILKQKKISLGLTIHYENNVTTWIYQFLVLPKSEKIQQWFRKIIGLMLFKKYIIVNSKPDIMHVHVYKAAITAFAIRNYYSIPIVITEHSSSFQKDNIPKFDYNIAKYAYNNSNLNIAVSNEFKNLLEYKYSVSFNYIPNVVNTNYFKPMKEQFKDTFKIRLLNIAYLQEKKNQLMLIEVFSKIIKIIPNLLLFIGGSGPEEMNLRFCIKKLGLCDSVFLLGKLSREEVRNEMQNCNIFVLPSKIETFGVVLIEAMSCGKPVVATKSGGPESIITEPYLGELVENSEEALLEGLIKAIRKLNHFNSDEIRNFVIKHFSPEAIAQKLTNTYENLLENF